MTPEMLTENILFLVNRDRLVSLHVEQTVTFLQAQIAERDKTIEALQTKNAQLEQHNADLNVSAKAVMREVAALAPPPPAPWPQMTKDQFRDAAIAAGIPLVPDIKFREVGESEGGAHD